MESVHDERFELLINADVEATTDLKDIWSIH
jgi:hypothetical protein